MQKLKNQWPQSWFIICSILGVFMIHTGCGEKIPPRLDLTTEYQVFGVRAEPPVVRPDDQLTLTVYDHHPNLKDVSYSWSICLYSHGGSSHFECLKELSLPFTEITPRIVVDLSERGINLRTRLKALGQALNLQGERRSLEEGLDIFAIVKSGDPRATRIQTIKRIRVIDAPGDEPLAANPILNEWTIQESGVANLLDPCIMKASGPESALAFNEAGEVVQGTLRESVIQEISGKVHDESNQELDDNQTQSCILHSQSILDVQIDTVGQFTNEWNSNEGYTYRWYITKNQKVHTPITLGGLGFGRYELDDQFRSVDLYFTVRDSEGGFAVGRQEINLVPGISTR